MLDSIKMKTDIYLIVFQFLIRESTEQCFNSTVMLFALPTKTDTSDQTKS